MNAFLKILAAMWCAAAMHPALGLAQHEHGGGAQPGTIRSIPADEVAGLLDGQGMGMARAAELNHYPGPLHVLELADSLGLTEEQRMDVQEVRSRMLERATALGHEVLEREGTLDAWFRASKAEEEAVHTLVREVGALRAELRFVHLQAHLEMRQILSEEQIRTYDVLRGYTQPQE